MSNQDNIIIRGLRQNNLKNVSLDIPKGKIVVFTGVSGSGKSSIVFDTYLQALLLQKYSLKLKNLKLKIRRILSF